MSGHLPEQSRACISAKAAVSRFQPAALFHVCVAPLFVRKSEAPVSFV